MVTQGQKPRPENGMILLVIHDFTARSADELSLTRGDKVELIERDDDFGDGWYLGRHLDTGATGLFPEVYTKIAPPQIQVAPASFQRSTPVVQQQHQFVQPPVQQTPQQAAQEYERQQELQKQQEQEQQQQQQQQQQRTAQQAHTLSPTPIDTNVQPNAQLPSQVSPVKADSPIKQVPDNRTSLPTPQSPKGAEQLERHVSAGQVLDSSPQEPAPLQPQQHAQAPESPVTTRPLSSNGVTMTASAPPTTVLASAIPKNVLANQQHPHGADSPVMNEALAVIQEHISDMSTPRNSQQVERNRAATNDSGSEYSMHIDHPGMDPRRMSYINGSETDEEEEEERRLNRAEVNRWNPEQVSEYLASVGVEAKHCEVFRDQEISGDVLLGMDQPTVFLKEFDLGSVGRRLKTWQKIKALQDEVTALPVGMSNARRQTSNFSSDYGSDAGGSRVFSGMSGPSRVTSSGGRPDSRSTVDRYSRQRTMNMNSIGSIDSQATAYGEQPQQTRPSTGAHRPSAASIRELNHSRRHSSIDSPGLPQSSTPNIAQNSAGAQPQNHKKLPSFDRNWTMGSQPSSARDSQVRPVSQAGAILEHDELEQTQGLHDDDVTRATPVDFDRGYFSGTEVETSASNRNSRNVLKKRISTHSRNSSYTEEARQRSATHTTVGGNRMSRFGSMDSIQQQHVSPAGAKYYGLPGSRRTPSVNNRSPAPPPKDQNGQPSPTVTKLEDRGERSPTVAANPDWLKPNIDGKSPREFRAISDAVTGQERKMLGEKLQQQPHNIDVASPTHSSTHSPSRTGSSTPSGGPSLDLGDSKTSLSSTTPKAARKKSKKETSAYTRGLLKISPKEAMKDCDYSGWMKKKSTNLMTTWKPRLFILKGRRLSYYYSEDDTEEKGLIDISFHRVLPADQDRLTGLHAQLTGAMASPSTPKSAISTTAQSDAINSGAGVDNSMFIFKLVPPRAGLSRAVTFTKPTVHYFAVENVAAARLWMAALMKATIEREGDGKVTTTYQQKTVSLRRAREMRQRPPALMGDDDVPITAGLGGAKAGGLGLGLSIEDREGEEKEEERLKEERRGEYRGVEASA